MDAHLRDLRYFVAVAEELNFTRAAERLHLSQPALSKQIRGLETTLRAQLFRRDRRQVELTAAGIALHTVARSLLQDWDDGVHQQTRRNPPRLVLRDNKKVDPAPARRHALHNLCRVLMNSAEFLYVD